MPVPGSETSTVRLIHRALEHSKDGGETLDLSRERIDRIGDEEVEVFRTQVGKDNKGVWRLALSYNSLRDGCITPRFASLTRLRYLNLKGNQLTGIPTPVSFSCSVLVKANQASCASCKVLRFLISQKIRSRRSPMFQVVLHISRCCRCRTTA